MLADAQALPSLRPEIEIKWADQSAMLESFSRPQFREAVVFQPLHWYNEFQLQESMVKDRPNVHPGDMLIHFAGLMKDKREFMGPWLDKVENMADRWTVPLENTSYLTDVKEYWDTYGRAKDVLDRANQTIALELSDPQLRQPVLKAFEDLQNIVWKAAEDIDGMRSHIEFLTDTLQQAVGQEMTAESQLRAEAAQAQSSKAQFLEPAGSTTKMSKVETLQAGTAGSADGDVMDSHALSLPGGESNVAT